MSPLPFPVARRVLCRAGALAIGVLVGSCGGSGGGLGAGDGSTVDSGTTTDTGDPDDPDDSGSDGLLVPPSDPVVVYLVLDTLGQAAADAADVCGRLAGVAAAHGVDLGCHSGGLSPASWTIEAHNQLLWPSRTGPDSFGETSVSCDDPSVLRRVVGAAPGNLVVGLGNPIFSAYDSGAPCEDGLPPFVTGAGHFDIARTDGGMLPLAELAAQDTVPSLAVSALLERTAQGGPAAALLNEFWSGGHNPRCLADPFSEACDALWAFAVENGLVDEEAARAPTLASSEFYGRLEGWATYTGSGDDAALRTIFYDTIVDAADGWSTLRVEPLVDQLLTGLGSQGRLDDLVLVITSDHGESPCVDDVTADVRNCTHGGLANAWVAQVPLMIAPAALGAQWQDQGLVGADGEVFAVSNVAFGIADHLGLTDADWPAPIAVGTARTASCWDGYDGVQSMVLVATESAALRCRDDDCVATGWGPVDDLDHTIDLLDETPAVLQDAVELLGSRCSR